MCEEASKIGVVKRRGENPFPDLFIIKGRINVERGNKRRK
jgi:hypothetical protein